MIYLVAFFISPLALLIAGKPFQAVINLVIWCLAWFGLFFFLIPGVLLWAIGAGHAMIVISQARADARTERLVQAVERGQGSSQQ